MSRSYVKMECLAEEVFRRKEAGETNREIGEHFGLNKKQIKQLVSRQNRKKCLIANGYIPRPKGLYIIGDGSGITHSLSHASASGVHVARRIAETRA